MKRSEYFPPEVSCLTFPTDLLEVTRPELALGLNAIKSKTAKVMVTSLDAELPHLMRTSEKIVGAFIRSDAYAIQFLNSTMSAAEELYRPREHSQWKWEAVWFAKTGNIYLYSNFVDHRDIIRRAELDG